MPASKNVRFRFGWAVVALLPLLSTQVNAGVIPVDWGSETSGDLNGVGVRLTNISTPFGGLLTDFYLGPASDFAAAPLPPGTQMVQYAENSNWTATFAQPVNNLLLYVIGWRGQQSFDPDDPSTYTFDRPFTVLSGLEDVSVSGNTLTIPDTGGSNGYHSGIIQFSGPVTSISVVADIPMNGGHGQVLTFATDAAAVPEPSTIGLTCVGAILLMLHRARRTSQRTV